MIDFFRAVLAYSFLSNALLAGVLASIACGVVGTYVVSRRITYLAGGMPITCQLPEAGILGSRCTVP
jgi:zinc transport system permease protein